MTDFVLGLLAGFVATIPMSAVMLSSYFFLPRKEQYTLPPQEIIEQLLRSAGLRDNVGKSLLKLITTFAHFGYGALAGGVFGFLMSFIETRFVICGIVFGMIVWVGSYLILLPLLNIGLPQEICTQS